jgi:hypothetical protein
VKGWRHDNRHALIKKLAESGAGDEVIMSIVGQVSRAMLSLYSQIRMEAKRRALDEIAVASKRNCADLAAIGESVVRVFLEAVQ